MTFENGLYLITDERLLPRKVFIDRVRRALASGRVDLLQLREKLSGTRDRTALGLELVRLARRHGVRVVVNDDPRLALRLGADGVHLGRADASVEEARALLGPRVLIGVSCYGDVGRALDMQRRGADYASFGAFAPSPTKPAEPLVPLAVLGEARRRLRIPVVAIGGAGPANARELAEAGADGLAVVSSVFGRRDIPRALEELHGALRPGRKG